MADVYFKRGDTFSLDCQWLDSANTPIDLTGATIESKVRSEGFVDTLTVSIVDAAQGQFTLSRDSTDTALWPVTESQSSRLFCDIQRTIGSVVKSTKTFQIVVEEDIT